MAKRKDEKEVVVEAPVVESTPVVSEKEKLLALYKHLKDLNVRSISDLENMIARA